ncbi:MAG: 1-acyl-sn-glycerol-3-phosphate acyltransferase [Bacteroidales bacterium]|nr:1-acyl-sn-glycerol-3-phosphate acyltransferase [Bacteroidales bacterium]
MPNKLIDIDRVIAAKSPKLQRRLPRFVVNYLKRTLHQDDLNGILERHGHLRGAELIGCALDDMQVSYTAHGLDLLPSGGRYIFASNHPLGGLDGMVLIHLLGTRYGSIKFPVNDFLMAVEQLHDVFVPINKVGAQSAENHRLLNEAFASDAQMLYFPAGLCSRRQGGKIEDLEWKKTFVIKAIEHQRDVVPVFFEGRNSNFFYRLAQLRGRLGIKFNIEMLYLVDEMFKQSGKPISVWVGEPIAHSTFDSSKTPAQWAAWLKQRVYAMNPNGDKNLTLKHSK